jgi:sugar phosphate isomerase/epimerase
MKKKNSGRNKTLSRRQFIKNSLALTAGAIGTGAGFGMPAAIGKSITRPDSHINGVQISVISYSYRSMPDQSVEGLLKDIVNDGINAVELMGEPAERFAGKPSPDNPAATRKFRALTFKKKTQHGKLDSNEQQQFDKVKRQTKDYNKKVAQWRTYVSMDKFAEIREIYNDLGVSIYAWKPDAFGKNNTDAEINYAFNVAKVLGASACTTEHPGDDAQTKRLGDIASRHKLYMAYHAHTQASPTLWDTALKQSKWNAINLDVGHWIAGGNPSPLPFIKKYHNRIESLHLKDRTTPADGDKNLVWGTGDTPLTQVLQLMRDQHYSFPAAIELEYKIPKSSNAVKEVSKCVHYCRRALES